MVSRNAVTVCFAVWSSPAMGKALRPVAPYGRARVARCSKYMVLNALTTCEADRWACRSSEVVVLWSSSSAMCPSWPGR